jgi:hypothetical protein
MIIKGIEAIPQSMRMGKDVYDDLTYCMQQWQEAGYKAAMGVPEPEKDTSLEWAITLFGNLLWAATVFFPPAFVTATAAKITIAAASTATKAASMLGATLAAGTLGKLINLDGKLNSQPGKQLMSEHLAAQVPALLKQYADDADLFMNNSLIFPIRDAYAARLSAAVRSNDDDHTEQFKQFIGSVAGAQARRKAVWEKYVFLGQDTLYDNQADGQNGTIPGGQLGLQKVIGKELDLAVADFKRQWKNYNVAAERYASAHSDRRSYGRVPTGWGQYITQVRLYKQRTPFKPVFTYNGIPQAVVVQQQANRQKLAQRQYAVIGRDIDVVSSP